MKSWELTRHEEPCDDPTHLASGRCPIDDAVINIQEGPWICFAVRAVLGFLADLHLGEDQDESSTPLYPFKFLWKPFNWFNRFITEPSEGYLDMATLQRAYPRTWALLTAEGFYLDDGPKRYRRLAQQFEKETGLVAPGLQDHSGSPEEERARAWEAWARNRRSN